MSRRAAYACAAVLAFLGVLTAPAAQGATPVPHVTVHLSRTVVASGDPVTVTAHANALCDWIVTFAGERRHEVSRSIRTTFTTPEVTRRTRLNVVVTCVVHTPVSPPGSVPAATGSGADHDVQALVVGIPASTTLDPPLTVLPGPIVSPPEPGHEGGSGLPSTGGPAYWLVLAGLAALLLGSVLVRLRPRSLPASRA